MKKVYVCSEEKKDRVYVIEDIQMTLFDEPHSFTIHFGRRNKWLNRKHICCNSLSDKEKKIAEIDRKRKRHGYKIESHNAK
jgi:hypothetical protein